MRAGLVSDRAISGIALFVVAAILLWLPAMASPYSVRVLQAMIFAAGLAMSWNLLGGFGGYGSFGHAAFVGLSAFACAQCSDWFGAGSGWWGAAASILIGTIAAAALAALIAVAVIRLRGLYFAMATLGIGEVLKELFNNVDALNGASGVTLPDLFAAYARPEIGIYYMLLAAGILIFAICAVVRYSKLGYGLISIREDEDTAMMLAVPTRKYKVVTFAISGGMAGLLGAIYAYSLGYITTDSVFRADFSLFPIVYCLLGGIGTLLGPVIGAVLMTLLTQVLLADFLAYHLMSTGIVLVLLVLLLPKGILGVVETMRKRRRTRSPIEERTA